MLAQYFCTNLSGQAPKQTQHSKINSSPLSSAPRSIWHISLPYSGVVAAAAAAAADDAAVLIRDRQFSSVLYMRSGELSVYAVRLV